ncbi:MAG: hypothetical protein HYX69_13365 [Planctomycetia bacterium]|nr:hypothetical protein [Planctomycetia bacterium]
MAVLEARPRLAPHVDALLAGLRDRIRRYIWVEGLAATVATLCAAFWLCLGVDYLLEPPVALRRILLAVAAIGTLVVFYRFVVRRVTVPLSNANLALLLERRYRDFEDGLLTSVNLTQSDQELGELARDMLAHTCHEAADRAQGVRLREVFNRIPLARSVGAAVLLVLGLAGFALARPDVFRFGVERITGAIDEPWPRDTRLVVPGFEKGEKVIAKGDDLEVLVQADMSMPLVPEVVRIRWRTDEGIRGRETMNREGNATAGRDEYQDFRFTMQSVLSSLTFDVLGGDDRVRGLRVRVVESPTVSEAWLVCEYPRYMHRAPRELPVTGSMQIPLGAKVKVRARANKDLERARIDYAVEREGFQTATVPLPGPDGDLRTFEFAVPEFDSDKTLSFTLFDTDGIHNRKPFVVALSAVTDEPPQLSVQLHGIGTAISPLARLPLVGKINDDYGVAATAFDFMVDGGDPQRQPFAADPAGASEVPVEEAFEVRDLELKPGQKLLFGAQATDAFYLVEGDQPHTATSEHFQLDVVTPEALRAMLESRELNLRQRFETIIAEVTETRDSLTRLETGGEADKKKAEDEAKKPADGTSPESATSAADKPAEAASPTAEPAAAELASAAAIQVERARQNSEKNAQETLGVATAFDEIREELINNRIDTPELKTRLKEYIADPLRTVGEQMFPELDGRLKTLSEQLRDPAQAAAARRAALAQADAILVRLTEVRDKMLELESFNEAIELLRGIIDSEKALQQQTRERQKRNLRGLLEDSK